MSRVLRISRRLFAGDRRVWVGAAALGVPLLVLALLWCVTPRAYYTGTDSVNAATISTPIGPHTRVCVSQLYLPRGTRRIELGVATGQARAPRLVATVHTAHGTARTHVLGPTIPGTLQRVALAVPRLPASAESVPARVCLRSTAGTFGLWGTETTEGLGGELRVHRALSLYRVSAWYLPRRGARTSYLGELGRMTDRAALFAPGFLRPWLLYLVFFGVLPLIGLCAVRLLAVTVAGETRTRRIVAWLFIIAALNGMSWSVITPAFQSPDEVDHFAYTESLVERGLKPTPDALPIPRWSTAENTALTATGFFTDHVIGDTRAPGTQAQVRAYRTLAARSPQHRDDGGGNETTASYGPLYYYAIAPGYLLGGSEFSRLGGMRLFSALIGALAGVFAFLTIRELAPRRTWLAVLGALALEFEPMYSFLSGAVNNDIGIDAGAAIVAYLLVRLVRRGLPPGLVLVLGAVLGGLPWVKSSAYELWVLGILAGALALWRHRPRLRRLAPLGVDAGALAAWLGAAVLLIVAYLLGRHLNTVLTPPTPAGLPSVAATSSTGAATGTVSAILATPQTFVSYIWQVFLPDLPGMHRHFPPGIPAYTIFMRRGWAAFGWYDVFFPGWVYNVLEAAMALAAAGGLWALWHRRSTIGDWWPALALVVVFPIVVFLGFEAAFYTPSSRLVIAEMGRYEFPALVPLAALGVGGLLALSERVRVYAGSAVLVGFLALCYAGQALTFVRFFG